MISVEEALANVTNGVKRLAPEQVSLNEALGRVLAEEVASRLTLPPTSVSSMDGYAVKSADVANAPVSLTRIGESQAGKGYSGTLGTGETVRIFTGAPVPEGADAVVMQENTDADGTTITIKESVPEGRFVRPAGMDFHEGEVLLHAGTVLSAREVGLAASMNVPWLMVTRRPRVAILATGDELVMPGEPLSMDQIISSNSVAVASYVKAFGGVPINLGIARDTMESLRQHLEGARGADLLVTIGGASVGDYDLVQKVMGEKGLDLTFYRVAMRPGKPLIFGHLWDVPVLGMPGNPVSAGVSSLVFLKAAMEVMLGIPRVDNTKTTAVLGGDLDENDERQDYLRAVLSSGDGGEAVATPFDRQDSAMMARFAQADCLIVRAPGAPAAKQGERVEIIPLRMGLLSL
ncbi:MAG: molybdopterin molybdotransferase MoeA [Rhodospirillales bacterium]|nr:molybdopterin molybdotransferase MoeA [Rhodospirillales bacterium]